MGARTWVHQAPRPPFPHTVAADGQLYAAGAAAGLPSAGMAHSSSVDLLGRAVTVAHTSAAPVTSPSFVSDWAAPVSGAIIGASQTDEVAAQPGFSGLGLVLSNAVGHEPMEPMSYELLLSTQQHQHALQLQSKEAEVAHLKACVDVLQAKDGSHASEYLSAALRKQEDAATLMMAAKHKELELMVGLLQLREQQIEDFRQLCEAQQLELEQLKQHNQALADNRGSSDTAAEALEKPGAVAAAQLATPLADLPQALPPTLEVTQAGSEFDAGGATTSAASSPTASASAQHRRTPEKSDHAQMQREVRRLRLRMEELESAVSEQHDRSSGLARALEVKAERVKALEEQVRVLQSPASVAEDQYGARSPGGPWPGAGNSLNASDAGTEASPEFGGNVGVSTWPRPASAGQQMFMSPSAGDPGAHAMNGAYAEGGISMKTQDLDVTRPVPAHLAHHAVHSGNGHHAPHGHHNGHDHHSYQHGQPFSARSHQHRHVADGWPADVEVFQMNTSAALHPTDSPLTWESETRTITQTSLQHGTQPATLDAMALRRGGAASVEAECRPASGGGLQAMAAAAANASSNHLLSSGSQGGGESTAVPVTAAATTPGFTAVHASSELDFTQSHLSVSGNSQVQSYHSAVRISGFEGVDALGATPASLPASIAQRSPVASEDTSRHSQELLNEMRRLRLQMSELERVAGAQRSSRRNAGSAAASGGERWPRGRDRLGASASSLGADSSSPGEPTFEFPVGEGNVTDLPTFSSGQGRSSTPATPLNPTSTPAVPSLVADGAASSTSPSDGGASWPSYGRSAGARSGHTANQQSPEYAGWEYLPDPSGDPIDAAVAALVNRPGRYRGWRVLLCRLEQGIYLCGTRRVHIRVDAAKERIEASDDGGKTWADLESLMRGAEASQRALLERARDAAGLTV